jgi:hypothetical protein
LGDKLSICEYKLSICEDDLEAANNMIITLKSSSYPNDEIEQLKEELAERKKEIDRLQKAYDYSNGGYLSY